MSYEAQIKQIIKDAARDGVVFTDKDMARIRAEAVAEMSAETARQMFGAKA